VAQDSQYFANRCFTERLHVSDISKEEKMLKRFYILKQSQSQAVDEL